MSLGYVWIQADDGKVYDVNETLDIKNGSQFSEITIFFEEYKDNSITWKTPKGNDSLVVQLQDYLLGLGFQTLIGKPHGTGSRTKWEAPIQVKKIPVDVVRENKGVCKGKRGDLKCEFTIAGGVF